jgi:hypothetical protein
MDLKTAVKIYQFAERAKSELIICSQLATALAGFPAEEAAGGKRMLLLLQGAVRAELEFGWRGTEQGEFRKGMELLSGAISATESGQFGMAVLRIGEAISAVTTAAQGAFQVLTEHGLL